MGCTAHTASSLKTTKCDNTSHIYCHAYKTRVLRVTYVELRNQIILGHWSILATCFAKYFLSVQSCNPPNITRSSSSVSLSFCLAGFLSRTCCCFRWKNNSSSLIVVLLKRFLQKDLLQAEFWKTRAKVMAWAEAKLRIEDKSRKGTSSLTRWAVFQNLCSAAIFVGDQRLSEEIGAWNILLHFHFRTLQSYNCYNFSIHRF